MIQQYRRHFLSTVKEMFPVYPDEKQLLYNETDQKNEQKNDRQYPIVFPFRQVFP